jgi:hypothetical protein
VEWVDVMEYDVMAGEEEDEGSEYEEGEVEGEGAEEDGEGGDEGAGAEDEGEDEDDLMGENEVESGGSAQTLAQAQSQGGVKRKTSTVSKRGRPSASGVGVAPGGSGARGRKSE